jgi:hypothetical protein
MSHREVIDEKMAQDDLGDLGVAILHVLWLVGALSGVEECPANDSACEVGTAIGTGIGVFLIVGLWFFGFIILSIVWLMTKSHSQSES